jgi:DNA-binding XRE family transcriptional regulator
MTQEALAQEAGVTVGHMSMIERGHSNPTWGTVKRVAKAIRTPIADLARMASEFED